MKDQGVKLYHTFSETKVSIAERMIRTLKMNCEKIKTQYELEEKDFKLYDILPYVLEEYNFTIIHSIIQLTPSDARKLENQNKLQQRYKSIYENYNTHSSPKSPTLKYLTLVIMFV